MVVLDAANIHDLLELGAMAGPTHLSAGFPLAYLLSRIGSCLGLARPANSVNPLITRLSDLPREAPEIVRGLKDSGVTILITKVVVFSLDL